MNSSQEQGTPGEVLSFLSFVEGSICAEVVRQVGAQHPSLAMAMAGAIANESDEQGEQIGRMLTPEDFAFVNRVVLRVLAAFGIDCGEA